MEEPSRRTREADKAKQSGRGLVGGLSKVVGEMGAITKLGAQLKWTSGV